MVIGFFDEIAARYDELRPVEGEILAALLRKLHVLSDGGVLLDVGCGTGRYSIPLAKKLGLELVGVDSSKGMLHQARKKWPAGRWLHGRIEEVLEEVHIGMVDAVLIAYALHFLRWRTTLGRLRPILRSPGAIVIVTYEPEIFERALYHRFVPGLKAIDQRRFPKSAEVVEKLTALGLSAATEAVTTVHRIETVEDVTAAIERGRARYCSTLRLVAEEVVEQSLARMEAALLRMVNSGPVDVVYEHTLITGTVLS